MEAMLRGVVDEHTLSTISDMLHPLCGAAVPLCEAHITLGPATAARPFQDDAALAAPSKTVVVVVPEDAEGHPCYADVEARFLEGARHLPTGTSEVTFTPQRVVPGGDSVLPLFSALGLGVLHDHLRVGQRWALPSGVVVDAFRRHDRGIGLVGETSPTSGAGRVKSGRRRAFSSAAVEVEVKALGTKAPRESSAQRDQRLRARAMHVGKVLSSVVALSTGWRRAVIVHACGMTNDRSAREAAALESRLLARGFDEVLTLSGDSATVAMASGTVWRLASATGTGDLALVVVGGVGAWLAQPLPPPVRSEAPGGAEAADVAPPLEVVSTRASLTTEAFNWRHARFTELTNVVLPKAVGFKERGGAWYVKVKGRSEQASFFGRLQSRASWRAPSLAQAEAEIRAELEALKAAGARCGGDEDDDKEDQQPVTTVEIAARCTTSSKLVDRAIMTRVNAAIEADKHVARLEAEERLLDDLDAALSAADVGERAKVADGPPRKKPRRRKPEGSDAPDEDEDEDLASDEEDDDQDEAFDDEDEDEDLADGAPDLAKAPSATEGKSGLHKKLAWLEPRVRAYDFPASYGAAARRRLDDLVTRLPQVWGDQDPATGAGWPWAVFTDRDGRVRAHGLPRPAATAVAARASEALAIEEVLGAEAKVVAQSVLTSGKKQASLELKLIGSEREAFVWDALPVEDYANRTHGVLFLRNVQDEGGLSDGAVAQRDSMRRAAQPRRMFRQVVVCLSKTVADMAKLAEGEASLNSGTELPTARQTARTFLRRAVALAGACDDLMETDLTCRPGHDPAPNPATVTKIEAAISDALSACDRITRLLEAQREAAAGVATSPAGAGTGDPAPSGERLGAVLKELARGHAPGLWLQPGAHSELEHWPLEAPRASAPQGSLPSAFTQLRGQGRLVMVIDGVQTRQSLQAQMGKVARRMARGARVDVVCGVVDDVIAAGGHRGSWSGALTRALVAELDHGTVAGDELLRSAGSGAGHVELCEALTARLRAADVGFAAEATVLANPT